MTARAEPWVCVFGSNLFYQLDPDDRNNPTKKIIYPRNLKDTRIPRGASVEVLLVTDSQTLVHYKSSESTLGSSYLEIWGFDEEDRSSIKNIRIQHPVDQVKQWLGTTKILGYLAKDGTINPFNLKTQASNESREKIDLNPTGHCPRYQAVTITDHGEVLAALSYEASRTPDLKIKNYLSHHLELWSCFQELLDFCRDGVKTNSNPKSIKLESSPLGETEIQLSSGASHFLILTHTPSRPNHRVENEDSDYHSTLYAFGDNRFGQIGIGSRSVLVDKPRKIENLPALSSIHCGLFHSLALGKDGELYAFGHNRKGQCGVGSSKIDTSTPILIDLGGNGEAGDIIDVIDARCGSEHTVLLTSSGVWVTGSNALGQLGMKDSNSIFEFQRNEKIRTGNHAKTTTGWKIETGRWNTFIWTNSLLS